VWWIAIYISKAAYVRNESYHITPYLG
jgi:hypothetical protein